MEKLFAHRENPIPPLPGASRALQAVFRRMVAKRPEERFPSMADAITALQAGSSSSPRRKLARLWLAGGGIGTAAAVLLSLAFLGRTSDPVPETRTRSVSPEVRLAAPHTAVAVRPGQPELPVRPAGPGQVPVPGGGVSYKEMLPRPPFKKLAEPQEQKKLGEMQERVRDLPRSTAARSSPQP